jgi:hypothetical protein
VRSDFAGIAGGAALRSSKAGHKLLIFVFVFFKIFDRVEKQCRDQGRKDLGREVLDDVNHLNRVQTWIAKQIQ